MRRLIAIITFGLSIAALGQIPTYRWVSGSQDPQVESILEITVPNPRQGAVSFVDSLGNFWLFGGEGNDVTNSFGLNNSLGILNDLWKYDISNKKWVWVNGYEVTDKPLPEYNNSLSFDGIDDEVIIPNEVADFSANVTIEAFFKTTADGPIFSFSPMDQNENEIGLSILVGDGGTNIHVQKDGFLIATAFGTLNLFDDEWHHVALVLDGDNRRLFLYVDGELKEENYNSIPEDLNPNNDHITTIGSIRGFGNTGFFQGQIDELRIWDIVLSEDEILSYISNKAPNPIEGLNAYYDFDQGVANSNGNYEADLYDRSENVYHGSLGNIYREGLFIGKIAEARLWDSPLSGEQITAFAKSPVDGTESGLNGAYDFSDALLPAGDNTAISTVADLSPNAYTGDLFNFSLIDSTSNFVEENLLSLTDKYDMGIPSNIAIARDFNGDGYEDIVANSQFGNFIMVLINDQSGGFGSPTSFDVEDNTKDITVGNFNNDLFLDIAVAAHDSDIENKIRVYFGDGTGDFPSFIDIDPGDYIPNAIESYDMNGDTFDDLVVLLPVSFSDGFDAGGQDEVHIYYGDGMGNFSSPDVFVVGNIFSESIAIADFNNDTHPDIIYGIFNPPAFTIGMLLNDGAGSFTQEADQRYGTNLFEEVYATDINQDGNQDLLISQGNFPGIVFGNGDGTFEFIITSNLGDAQLKEFDFIGFNGDNEMEVVASHSWDRKYYTLSITPEGTFIPKDEYFVEAKPGQIDVVDLDDNGFVDFVIPQQSNQLEILLAENSELVRDVPVVAMDFDGQNDHIEFADLGPFDVDFTFEGWIKTEDNGPIFSYTPQGEASLWDQGSNGSFALSIKDGRLAFQAEGHDEIIDDQEILRDNRWHHVAVSVNQTANEIILYIDGREVIREYRNLSLIAPGMGHVAKLGYATSNFSEFLGQTSQAQQSNWKEGTAFIREEVGRSYSAAWTDYQGNLNIFGGKGTAGFYNTIRQYDGTDWITINGTNTINDPGNYGTQGVADPANIPPARWAVEATVDLDSNIWIFGGTVDDDATEWLSDLWKYNPMLNEWIWVNGSNLTNQTPVYGTKGVSDPLNTPGPRSNHKIWTDQNGDLWMFGGYGLDTNGDEGYLNDLWKYSIVSNEWTWLSGSNEVDAAGVFGQLDEYNNTNMPGARSASIQWVDSNGTVWLFGGQGLDKFGISVGYLNDLWSYNPILNQWAWHSGSDFKGSTGSYNEQGLSSVDYVPGSRWHSTGWLDNDENLWLFGGYKFNQLSTSLYNDFWKYEPSTKEWTWLNGYNSTANSDELGVYEAKNDGSLPHPGARHGGLEWTDLNGNLWMLGGSLGGSSTSNGFLRDLWTYDTEKERWSYIKGNTDSELNDGIYGSKGIGSFDNDPKSRWHGASWTGKDGKLWFFGGINYNEAISNIAWLNDLWNYDPASEVFTWMGGSSSIDASGVYGIKGEASVAHVPGARSSSAYWSDSDGNFWLFGGYESFEYKNDLWKFNPNTLEWTWVSGNNFQNSPGIYGEMGVPNASNSIGARRYMDGRIDKDGNVWVFGGNGHDAEAQLGFMGDLWKYDPATNIWTWMSGSKFRNPTASYGTKGVASVDNQPPGRYGHSMWIDDSGNVWLYGGWGVTSDDGDNANSFAAEFNDLWKFDVKTNLWTWVGGTTIQDYDGVYGEQGVFSEDNVLPGRARAQTFRTNDKTLRFFGGREGPSFNSFWEIKFTPDFPSVEPASNINQTTFFLAYDEPWAREYQVQVATSDDFSVLVNDEVTSAQSSSISDLDPGTYYYYRVTAVNEIGDSGFGEINSVLTLPDTPTFASFEAAITDLTSTQVNLNWEVTDGILDGYYINVSQDPTFTDATQLHEGFEDKPIAVTQTLEIPNLIPGTQYYTRLRSYNASGFSTYSQVVPFLTRPATVIYPEEEVTDVTLVSAVVNWEPVSGIVDNYQITVSTLDDGFADETQYLANYNRRSIPTDRTSITVEGLESGTSYFAVVSAVNASGESEQPLKITILTAPSSPVFDVESSILSISQRDVTFNWESPDGFFEGYHLEVSIDQSFVNTNLMLPGYGRGNVPFELGQGELTTTVSDLIPGLTYYARIRAFNDAGVSPNSNILAFTTVPKAPVISQINNISQTEAFVKWQSTSGTDVYLMDVNTSPGFEAESEVLTELPLAVTLENLENLAPGTRYFVRVQASNSSGDSGDMTPDEYSDAYGEANFITIPADPVITEITYGQESVILNWPDVIGIDTYEVDASENFFLSYIDNYEALNINDSEVTIDGLDAGTEYQVRVRSKNESGESSYAQILDLLTLPETPTARDASNSSASVFTANWDAANGADYYILEVSNDDFQTFHYNEQLSSSNPEKIENLVAGTTYKYRVKAGNESGESPYSSEVTVIAQNTAQSLSISNLEFNDKFSETATSAVVTVTFSGGVAEPDVTIRHREILSTSWSGYKAMTRNSATEFQFTILSNMLDDIGVEFEIKADDDVTFIEQKNNKIKRTFTETSSEPLPDIDLGQWRMISIPYVLDDNLVLSIFNELGDLQYKKRWRLMTYLDGTYQDQGVGFTRIDLGRGYWFNSLNDVTISVGAGETNSTIPFEMALAQGWNQIGNPYNVSIDWDEILDENSLSINIGRLIIYDPFTKEFKESRTLSSFSGAFVFADEATVLSVSPVAGSEISARTEKVENEVAFNGNNWMTKLNLNWGGKHREIAAIGMHEQAQASKDQFDKLVVPRFENYLEMYTSDNDYFYPKFSHDIKSQATEQVWIYDLESNHISGLTELTWDPERDGNGRLWLVDETNGKITEMSNANSYSFAMNGHHQFSIHYSEDPNYQVVPTRLALGDIYPNPVNASAQIPLLLPKQSETYDLSLNLYNLNGQLIKNIASGIYSAGIYVFDINIEDLDLKDGMYFYGVTFKNTDQTPRQKKIIIKR